MRGETSERIAARWRNEARPRLLPGADARIVVSFGANDATMADGRLRMEPEHSRAALTDILDGVAALDVIPLMIGPAPVGDARQNERILALSASFSTVCFDASVRFIDVVEPLLADRTWMSQVTDDDGAHPSAGGMTRSPISSWLEDGRIGYLTSWSCERPASVLSHKFGQHFPDGWTRSDGRRRR